jgi:hypothetical protein
VRPAAAGAALAAVALLAACGCSGGENAEEAFRAEANAICADFDERIDSVPTPQTLAELADSAAEVAGLIEEGASRLQDLEPPEQVAQAWSDWLDLNDTAAESAAQISAAAAAEDRERIVELAEQADEDEAASDALAEELGLADCVVDSEGRER